MIPSSEQNRAFEEIQKWIEEYKKWGYIRVVEGADAGNAALPYPIQDWYQKLVDPLNTLAQPENRLFFKEIVIDKRFDVDLLNSMLNLQDGDSLISMEDLKWHAPNGSSISMLNFLQNTIGTMAYQTEWNMDEILCKKNILKNILNMYKSSIDPLLDTWLKDLCTQQSTSLAAVFEWSIDQEPIKHLDWIYALSLQPTEKTMADLLKMYNARFEEPSCSKWAYLNDKTPGLTRYIERVTLLHEELLGSFPLAQYLVENWMNQSMQNSLITPQEIFLEI